jgi:hypothetical protein
LLPAALTNTKKYTAQLKTFWAVSYLLLANMFVLRFVIPFAQQLRPNSQAPAAYFPDYVHLDGTHVERGKFLPLVS